MDTNGAPHRQVAALAIALSLSNAGALALEPASPSPAPPSLAKVFLNIPRNQSDLMILDFVDQTGIAVLVTTSAGRGKQLNPLFGEYEPIEGLRALLAGTGLWADVEIHNTDIQANVRLKIRRAPSAAGPGVVDDSILVTGSHIRNVLDVVAPLQIINKDESIGAGTPSVASAVQQLPASMGSALNEHFGGTGNFGRGTALNLRGLGAGATLVLVNGRRQPQAGLLADFVDVSNIPWSLVERIEVLPDGSSAVYGSDAIAGVVNIILRDALEGAESQLRMGTSPKGASELFAAQLFGHQWSTGRWLAAYQYIRRTSLAAADRDYAADADKRAYGGRNYRTARSNPGNILDPLTFLPRFAIPTGQDGLTLNATDLIDSATNLQNQYSRYELLPSKESHGISFSGTQSLTSRIKMSSEARLSQRDIRSVGLAEERVLLVPRSNAFFVDPFGGSSSVRVAYNFADDFGPIVGNGTTRSWTASVGAEALLTGGWLATLAGTFGRESLTWSSRGHVDPTGAMLAAALADSNPATAFNPFGDGSSTTETTLDSLRAVRNSEAASTISTVALVADGPLLDLPGGVLKAAFGLEARAEELDRKLIGRDFLYRPQHYRRSITAGFSEFVAPLIGQPSDPKLTPRLQLSLAGRYERYSDFGSTFNPKIGLQWAPLESVKLRSTWSTAFRAPKLVDLYDVSQNLIGPALFPDLRSSTGQSMVVVWQGSNPNLREETARTWMVGVDLAPRSKSDLVVSLSAYSTRYDNQIVQPGALAPFNILLEEERWAEVITRSPSADLLRSLCAQPDLLGSVSQCLARSPAAFIDMRLRNMASTRASGLDLDVTHSLRTSVGSFQFAWSGHYIVRFDQAFTARSPAASLTDTVTNPLRLSLKGSAVWRHRSDERGLSIQAALSHIGGYNNTSSTMRPSVGSMTSLDLNLRYRISGVRVWWSETDLVLGATNLFNRDPPFVDVEYGYDPINSGPIGRVVSLQVQKAWGAN